MFQRRGVSKLSFAWAEGVISAIRASRGGFFSWGSRIDQAKPGGIASMQGHLLTRSRAQKVSPAPRLTAAWSPGAPTELERGGCGSRRMKARFLEATGTFWSGGAGRRLGEALPPPSLTGRGFPHRPLPNFRSSKEASPAGPRSRSLAS